MKQKLFYILAFICCLSFFSLAKQSGKNCDYDTCCPLIRQHQAKQVRPSTAKDKGFDLLPFRIFIFSI